MVLELLTESVSERQSTNWSQNSKGSTESQILEIHSPAGLDLSQNTEYASQAALWGIEVRLLRIIEFSLQHVYAVDDLELKVLSL